MISFLRVANISMQERTAVSLRADAGRFIVRGAIDFGAVVEGSVLRVKHRSAASLVGEVPEKAGERAVLSAPMVQKVLALLRSERLQIGVMVRFFWLASDGLVDFGRRRHFLFALFS